MMTTDNSRQPSHGRTVGIDQGRRRRRKEEVLRLPGQTHKAQYKMNRKVERN